MRTATLKEVINGIDTEIRKLRELKSRFQHQLKKQENTRNGKSSKVKRSGKGR